MLWKENYRIGVKLIDDEHKALYDYTDYLIQHVENPAFVLTEADMKAAFSYVENQVNQHFLDEEKYQRAIDYIGYEEHQKAHQKFRELLKQYRKKLEEANYSSNLMQEFIGILMYWLVNHITDYDLKITKNTESHNTVITQKRYTRQELNNLLHDSCREAISMTFRQMFQAKVVGYKKREAPYKLRGDFFCVNEIEVTGAGKYEITIGFRNDFAIKLMDNLSNTKRSFKKIDQIVVSAMGELADVISTRIEVLMEDNHVLCTVVPVKIRKDGYEPREASAGNEVIYLEVVTNLGSYDMMVYHTK